MAPTINRIVILFTLNCLGACSTAPAMMPAKPPSFEKALKQHIDAITGKDLTAYKNTITVKDDLYLIFPDGTSIETTEGVFGFHRDWFKDEKWLFEPKVVKILEGSNMATAVIKYDNRDSLESPPRSSWLVMVFELEDIEWRLVHDQNTRIQ